jgi:hypothetical protein
MATLTPDTHMEYRVIPFTAKITNDQGAAAAASQLASLIATNAAEGWEYVRLEQVETHVAGTAGCFGIGALPSSTLSVSMAVFRR